MSEGVFDATDSEVIEAMAEGELSEAGPEGEATGQEGLYDSEDARSDARRRQILQARQRQAPPRRPAPPPPPRRPAVTGPSGRQVMTAIRSLDLDTKVELDALRRALNEANRLAYRNAWAAEASVAASQALDSFDIDLAPHDWARALIRGVPTLLVASPKPRRRGLDGLVGDPRVGGAAVLGAIWAIGHFRGRGRGVADVRIATPSPLATGATGQLSGIPVDSHGRTVTATVTWQSDNPTVLSVTPTGRYEALVAGTANVTATADNVSVPISITVQ